MAARLQSPHSPPTIQTGSDRLMNALWWIMLLSCVSVSIYATRFFGRLPLNTHFSRYIIPLRLHIAGGIGALLAGPWQFSGRLRARAMNFHRWLGRFYLIEVALSSVAGFAMATVSQEGTATHFGFGALALLWFFSGFEAYRMARKGDIPAHRNWMIRNFGLSLAAVTLRVYLPLLLLLHWSFRQAYITVAWLCWVPNLLVAEWLVQRRFSSAKPHQDSITVVV